MEFDQNGSGLTSLKIDRRPLWTAPYVLVEAALYPDVKQLVCFQTDRIGPFGNISLFENAS